MRAKIIKALDRLHVPRSTIAFIKRRVWPLPRDPVIERRIAEKAFRHGYFSAEARTLGIKLQMPRCPDSPFYMHHWKEGFRFWHFVRELENRATEAARGRLGESSSTLALVSKR